jgi:hypothetical protein
LTARSFHLFASERGRVLRAADAFLAEQPVTITAAQSARSAGGKHDYFSEGDYWWPDPQHPNGPYIQRDGESNPDNFAAHRRALIRLSVQAPALAAAWQLTKQRRYAEHTAAHLRAWFLDASTRMNPNLQYAQAIHGRTTGRGTGIIDTIHLVEVVRGASAIEQSGALDAGEIRGLRGWFTEYLTWLTTSKNGLEERDAKNNHGTCWVMQAAQFARYTGREEILADCRERFKTILLPGQVAADGSFPLELKRTKPYSYSLFNLEAFAAACQTCSEPQHNLWSFRLPDGRSIATALSFMYPYIAHKDRWPYPRDVMYFDQWPLRQQSLLFGGLALKRAEYLDLWSSLNEDPKVEEAVRNYPIRQPVLWLSEKQSEL